ncbi:hypothetical protein QWZ13_12965 [Reinekea marina]|uniref:hypothetical protein n=1 Tax=Reinekea marina TaxID=1310421 RepID=UPI0025B5A9E2|nr:hypothetical protein [Reinekea marina]MDN3649824.1 hypothetical protein [Reinekea marina]
MMTAIGKKSRPAWTLAPSIGSLRILKLRSLSRVQNPSISPTIYCAVVKRLECTC